MPDHSFQRAGDGLERVLTRSLRHVANDAAPVLAWPLACGSAVAERTRALEFSKGVLHVEVADPGWKKELQALAPRYLATINRYVTEAVNRIEFVIKK
jgi:Dna[CI] antecedent, DciA